MISKFGNLKPSKYFVSFTEETVLGSSVSVCQSIRIDFCLTVLRLVCDVDNVKKTQQTSFSFET